MSEVRKGEPEHKSIDFTQFENTIKARAHKGGVRIGKTPKKLASICCP
jgi:hypothetical protein